MSANAFGVDSILSPQPTERLGYGIFIKKAPARRCLAS
jgi:hypothetical protein